MRRSLHIMALLAIGLSLMCWVPSGTSSADDSSSLMVDDYYPGDLEGTGSLIWYTSVPQVWFGTGSASGDITGVRDSYGDLSWGNEVDRKWICFWQNGYGVWDLGEGFDSVALFPWIDHPELTHPYHYQVWGSDSFDVSQASAATWVPAQRDRFYVKGWSDVGEGVYAVCNDDYVSEWSWPSGTSYRFIKVNGVQWYTGQKTIDCEVDAVKGVTAGGRTPVCGAWETDIVEEGSDFRYTSLEVGTDNRTHVAYGEEQLYYALRDDSTWHVQEVDKGGVGAYCSLALDSLGRPAISYYDGANGDLKYAYQNGTLNDVWGAKASDIYAVGDSGTIIHYDGETWSPTASGNTQALYGVWGSGSSTIFAVGAGGTILRYNGYSWSSMISGTTSTLYGVWGTASNSVFAVGDGGTVLYYNGITWGPLPSGTGLALRGVWGTSATNIFAVGDSGTIRRYDGVSWSGMTSGTAVQLSGVWGSSASDVYAVGDQGVIRRYGGSGVIWTSVYSSVTDCLGDVWGSSASDIFAVGCRGTVIHFGGTSWSQMISETTNRLNGVWGSSGTDVVAVGYDGVIIRYDGTIWTQMASGNGWLTQTVDSLGDVGQYTSLAFYGGSPAISYYDATNGDLKYAYRNSTTGIWTRETVHPGEQWVGEYTSLAFDSLGRAAISYYDATNEDLKLARWDGECWVISTIDNSGDVGRHSSLAFDSSWNMGVGYHDATAGTLKFARWNGAAWEIEVVDDEGWVGWYVSLAFDSLGQAGMSYFDVLKQDLKYAHWNGTEWDVSKVDSTGNVGSYGSLDFDTADGAVISYYDGTNDGLKVADREGTGWNIETVDTYPWVGRFSSLGFDPENNPAISYYNPREGELRYALWQKDRWVIDSVDVYGDVGRYTSLKFDSSGSPSISYYEVSRRDLKYAHWNGSVWETSTVDGAGDVGSYSSLAFDSAGNPAISYYDATRGGLKFSQWANGAWVTSLVDDEGDVGGFSSLDFDALGNPGIAYYDATNGRLKCAYFNGSAWVVGIVDSIGFVDRVESFGTLRFYCEGNAAISYYDALNGDLKYAEGMGTDWVLQTVDSKGQVGLYSSLTFDSLKNPVISYHDASNGALKVARWNGEKWNPETIDAKQAAGHHTSLAFDRCGSPAVSYDSPVSGDLKYACLANPEPNTPVNVSPANGATLVSLTPVLQCEAFADPCTDSHRASQWVIVTDNCEVNCGIVFDGGVDLTNLLTIQVPPDVLLPYTTYYWSVRHQDCRGEWSLYSAKTAFTTESPPERPTNISPEDGALAVSMTPTLVASEFADPEPGDRHAASQWQILSSIDDNVTPLLDQTTQGGSLTRFSVPAGVLTDDTIYYWRVRYQDDHGTWSELSAETLFSTTHRPGPPTNLEPSDGASKVNLTPILRASPFADPDAGETQKASQWRVTKIAGNYSGPIFDSGAVTSDLTQISVPSGALEHGASYYWQVRYQDSQGAWSNWSDETGFGTSEPPSVPAALVVMATVLAVVVVGGLTASMVAPL
jgi:hypothetical protein